MILEKINFTVVLRMETKKAVQKSINFGRNK